MRVRILRDVDYQPQAGDSQRCVGQLRVRKQQASYRFRPEGGVEVIEPKTGAQRFYFPAGSLPELSDSMAGKLIADGVAESYIGADVLIKTAAEMLDGMAVPK